MNKTLRFNPDGGMKVAIDWKKEERMRLRALLGEWPDDLGQSVRVVNVATEDRGTYILEKLVLDLNGIESAPAYFVKPKHIQGNLPVMLFNHSHGGVYKVGRDELLQGESYLQHPSYAELLTSLGFAALSFDAWCFGERATHSEGYIFKKMLWSGKVLWGMMIYDSMRAIDYLMQRDDIDSERVGTIGISMGGTMAWWLAAMDERVKLCVDMCSIADYDALLKTEALDRHGIYYYVPNILKEFTVGQINGLISPRPHLSLTGKHDGLVPHIGLDRIRQETGRIYEEDGAADNFQLNIYDCGHEETPQMREDIVAFLNKVFNSWHA